MSYTARLVASKMAKWGFDRPLSEILRRNLATSLKARPRGVPGGRQPIPTVARKAPPGLTPTIANCLLPIMLPTLRRGHLKIASIVRASSRLGAVRRAIFGSLSSGYIAQPSLQLPAGTGG